MISLDLPIIIAILFLIFLVIVVFYNRFYKEGKKKELYLIRDPTKFDESYEKKIRVSDLVQDRPNFILDNKGYGVTLKWEMYIPNNSGSRFYNSGFDKLKNIITIGESPQVYYHPKKGYLSMIFKYLDNPFYSHYPEIKIDNVPQQKWNKFILVLENRHVRVYMNGKLEKSLTLPNVLVLDLDEVNLGKTDNNFLGLIKNMVLYPYPLNFKEINELL